MRRGLGYMLAGMALAAAWLTSWQPDWLRSAWAAGPNMLYSTPGLTDAAWVAGSPGLPTQCVFDNTPVTVGDGDRQVIRCATATGVVAVGTLAGAPLLIDVVAWNGVAPTAAAALADGAANPTAPRVGASGLVWNGATWDRATGTTANGADVDVTRSVLPTGAATEATLATLATQATLAAVLADTATIDSQTLAIQAAVEILDNVVAGAEAQVDVVAALPTGGNTIGTVNVGTFPDNEPFNLAQVAGTAVDVDAGTVSAGTPRVIEAAPSGRTYVAIDPDQVEAAADIAANAARVSVTCQNVGTTAARVRVGAATGGTTGPIIGGGTVANNGTGGVFSTRDQGGVFLYDVAGAGNADVQCWEETS